MERLASKVFKPLDVANEALTFAMLITTIVVVFLAALTRYVIQDPLSWTEEVARFAFIWLAFLGISVAERQDAHFRIGYFVDLLPAAARRGVLAFNEIVIFGVLLLLMIEGLKFGSIGARGLSAVLQLPLHYIYVALPVAVGLTAINRARRLVFGPVAPGQPAERTGYTESAT